LLLALIYIIILIAVLNSSKSPTPLPYVTALLRYINGAVGVSPGLVKSKKKRKEVTVPTSYY
jgi:hypothetical protein